MNLLRTYFLKWSSIQIRKFSDNHSICVFKFDKFLSKIESKIGLKVVQAQRSLYLVHLINV